MVRNVIKKLKSFWGIFSGICLLVVLLAVADMVLCVRPLSQEDRDKIVQEMAVYKPIYDPALVGWAWLYGPRAYIGEKMGLNASYRFISNKVVIPHYNKPIIHETIIFPTYGHELTHAKQRNDSIPRYMYDKLFHRNVIEAEAELEELRIFAETSQEGQQ